MNIGPDISFRFAKDLPDLAQNDVSVAAIVGRFRLGLHCKSDQRRICGPQDGRAFYKTQLPLLLWLLC